jgi:hypothetical protein
MIPNLPHTPYLYYKNGLETLTIHPKTLTLTRLGLSTFASDFRKSCRALAFPQNVAQQII